MNLTDRLVVAALALMIALPAAAQRVPSRSSSNADAQVNAVYKDIENTLGVVPEFFKAYPAFALEGAWEEMKSVQLGSNTALNGKQKELIGLAVSAQIPCKYCVYFHTETAKLNGATEDEIQHALAVAASTRHWSTILNGFQQDEAAFKAEMRKAAEFAKNQTTLTKKVREPAITDAKTALKDIEDTFGFVPTFFRNVPSEGIVGAWKSYKAVEVNPNAPLDEKTVGLIGLAVAAQTPCRYCVIADTEFAAVNDVGERERREAVTMAAIVRHWSTVLNGAQVDEDRFRRDVDAIVSNFKRSETRKGALR